MISKHSAIPVLDSLLAPWKINFTFHFLTQLFHSWWCETHRVLIQQFWMKECDILGGGWVKNPLTPSYIFSGVRTPATLQDLRPCTVFAHTWLAQECSGYAVVTTTTRLRFDGRSTAHQRSLRSQWPKTSTPAMVASSHTDLLIYVGLNTAAHAQVGWRS